MGNPNTNYLLIFIVFPSKQLKVNQLFNEKPTQNEQLNNLHFVNFIFSKFQSNSILVHLLLFIKTCLILFESRLQHSYIYLLDKNNINKFLENAIKSH